MPKIEPNIESFARIMVVGIGGSGKNAVNHMVNSKVRGVTFVSLNTDTQDLHHSLAEKKIHMGKNLTKGLGTGMDPELGKKAAEETKSEIQDVLKGADMVFLACGMGGGTGTGAAPIIARVAREQGILTVAVVTKPFFFEGNYRMKIAERGIEELAKEVDAIIIIPNDKLLQISDKNTYFKSAFAVCDDVLRQAVEGISDLITTPGIINVDFADIRAVMSNAGTALMGIGVASGEKRVVELDLPLGRQLTATLGYAPFDPPESVWKWLGDLRAWIRKERPEVERELRRLDGPVAALFMPPPDLLGEATRDRTDGYLYSYIRHGGVVMPAYGAQVTAEEAWHLINYIRNMQKVSPR